MFRIEKTSGDATPVTINLFDLAFIEGQEYTCELRTTSGMVFSRVDDTGRSLCQTHQELRSLADL